jgi:hypothetical protein
VTSPALLSRLEEALASLAQPGRSTPHLDESTNFDTFSDVDT